MEIQVAARVLSSALKTIATCEALASSSRPLRLVEIARLTDDQRAVVYQRLITLIAAGLVEQTAEGTFRLSLRFQYFAAQAMTQASLDMRAEGVLASIVAESGETASFAVLDHAAALIVVRAESSQLLRADLRVGARLKLDGSASGAALVAFAADDVRVRLAAAGVALPASDDLAAIRARGYAIFQPGPGGSVAAVAAPVFDASGTCVAVIAVSGPASRFNTVAAGPIAIAAARRLSIPMRGAA